MTDFAERHEERLYDGETRLGDVTVSIEAHAIQDDRDVEFLKAVQRIHREVEAEVQAIQDELDEEGEVWEA